MRPPREEYPIRNGREDTGKKGTVVDGTEYKGEDRKKMRNGNVDEHANDIEFSFQEIVPPRARSYDRFFPPPA